jgi:hypothetical protein
LARGAYILADPPNADPEVILIGTGSEVSLCLDAYERLSNEGVRARVVSMPSWELFDDQDRYEAFMKQRYSSSPRELSPARKVCVDNHRASVNHYPGENHRQALSGDRMQLRRPSNLSAHYCIQPRPLFNSSQQ